jgi:D-alanyl-D-alanine dipeptidase
MKSTNKKYLISSASDLQRIRYCENGEALVNLEEFCSDIICDYRRKDSNFNQILVRQSIAIKLQTIQQRLSQHNSKMKLLIVEGYRSPIYQERYFLNKLLVQYQKNPTKDFELLLEEVHQLVALPSVAGHPTGGAIDLTLAYNGLEIDMGGDIADFTMIERLPTHSIRVSKEQIKNRMLLHDLMIAERFAPFYGEWWHFSYGDLEWAAFYHLSEAFYAPIFNIKKE